MMSLLCRISVLILTLALAACSHSHPADQTQPAPAVKVITVKEQTVPLTHDFVGRLSAYRTADVRARVAGILLKRAYKEGHEVKKGQLLFLIDPTPFKAALASAEGKLAQARATYINDRVNAARMRKLAPKGYVSQTDLDNAEAAERTSKAAMQTARANVETARINLGYTRVTSPISGRAGEQQVTEGALVGQNTDTLLTTVSQVNPLYINFTISIGQLNDLRQAEADGDIQLTAPDQTKVQVSLPDGIVYPLLATLDFSSPTVDAATGTVKLRAVLPNPHFKLLPGTFVTLKVRMGKRHDALLVPQVALQRDIKGPYVLTVNQGGKVVQKRVVTDGMHGNKWIVTHGLDAGDQVIVDGIQSARIGQPVTVQSHDVGTTAAQPIVRSRPASAGRSVNTY